MSILVDCKHLNKDGDVLYNWFIKCNKLEVMVFHTDCRGCEHREAEEE